MSNKNLNDKKIPIQISTLQETNVDSFSVSSPEEKKLLASLRDPSGKVIPKEKYTLIIDYKISSFGEKIISTISTLTLGIIPLYSTSDADANIKILRGDTCVYKTKIDSRIHTYYGFWFFFLKTDSPDMLNWNESQNLNYFKYEAIRDRIEKRISKLMEDKTVYDKIMPKEQTPSKCSQE